jgi:uncharacterized membrane protein YbhN (UPF0104 family)
VRRFAWLRRGLLLVVLGFAVWAVIGRRTELAAALRELSPASVGLAFVPALLAAGVSLLMWRTMLAEFGFRLPLGSAARIFYVSQLGKYVPGSAWSILMQVDLGRRYGIARRTNVAVGVLVVVVAVTTGLALGVVLLPFGPGLDRYWWVLLVLPALLAGLHPRALAGGLGWLLRRLGREPLERTPSWSGLGRLAALQLGVWTALGLQVWILLVDLGAPPGRALLVAIGGYALAHSLGLLAIGLPAGAGVREAVLTLALSTVVPAASALLVALVARAVLTVMDLVLAGLSTMDIRALRDPRQRDETGAGAGA